MSEERDFIMARLAAARGHATNTVESIDGCISFFLFPEEDKTGKERTEGLDIISESAGEISRAIELAQAALEDLSGVLLKEGEPDDDDGDEDGD